MRSSRHTRPQRRRTSQSRCPGLAASRRCGRKLAVRSPCRSLFSSSVAVTTAGIALRFMPAGSACGLVCNTRQPCLRRFGLRLTCRSTGQRPAGKVSALRIVHLRRALPVTSNVRPHQHRMRAAKTPKQQAIPSRVGGPEFPVGSRPGVHPPFGMSRARVNAWSQRIQFTTRTSALLR